MHEIKLSHILSPFSRSVSHQSRWKALVDVTSALFSAGRLTVTHLGRHIKGPGYVKHKIKKVDRLLNNRYLLSERENVYRAQTRTLLGGKGQAVILVDWSPCGNRSNHILRASLIDNGRALTIYEEVHPESQLHKPRVEFRFLEALKRVIPSTCHCIIVTDAGFKSPWFQKVASLGWDFVGRLRNNIQYENNRGKWASVSSLHKTATRKIQALGQRLVVRTNPIHTFLFTVKQLAKQRKARNKDGSITKGGSTAQHRKSAQEPWVIASSIDKKKFVIDTCKKRMQIEQSFRDTKDIRHSCGLNLHRTRSAERLNILLLIASLALFVLWLIGRTAEAKNLHYRFQANTYRDRRVLSFVFLGRQVIQHCLHEITMKELKNTLFLFQQQREQL